jgi:acetaldehyde dehydrogenase/alcohol dehydrogenase
MEMTANTAEEIVGRAAQAAEDFRSLDQHAVDRIVRAVFEAAFDARHELARVAHEETGIGVYEHKVIKDCWASVLVYEDIRRRRTVGILSDDPVSGITEIAQPKGIIFATLPVTNPTSTAIFKLLICMKTRNAVILSPHRAARRACRRAAEILYEAARGAGAPENAVQWITRPEKEYLEQVMAHPKVALILATGTGEIVRRAQASGRPTLGVGPGNVPVYVHASADIPLAARYITHSKTFDNGTVCASEQALVVEPDVDRILRPLLEERGAYFCTHEQMKALGPVCYDNDRRTMKAGIVGKPAAEIAEQAGFKVPASVRLLIAEPEGVGREHPLSHEILAPVLAYYVARDYGEAFAICEAVSALGGIGHTLALYANDENVITDFSRMNVGRVVVNTPATQGAIGGIFNSLKPSLTLSCGGGAGNISTDNITLEHLFEIRRVARRRTNERWMSVPREVWLDPAIGAEEILDVYNRNY